MKDMKTVEDYNKREQLKYLKGQCLNIAGWRMTHSWTILDETWESALIKNAKSIYDEALKQKWLEYKPDGD